MGKCLDTISRHRFIALVFFTRLVYVIYAAVAISGYSNLTDLLGNMHVCNVKDTSCTSLSPIINACLMTNTFSIIIVLSYTALDAWLRFRDRAGCCKAPLAFTMGFKGGLNLCLMVTLMQSTASFFAVGLLVQQYKKWGNDIGSNDTTILACGGLSCLGAVLAIVECGCVWWVQLRSKPGDPLLTAASDSTPYTNTCALRRPLPRRASSRRAPRKAARPSRVSCAGTRARTRTRPTRDPSVRAMEERG